MVLPEKKSTSGDFIELALSLACLLPSGLVIFGSAQPKQSLDRPFSALSQPDPPRHRLFQVNGPASLSASSRLGCRDQHDHKTLLHPIHSPFRRAVVTSRRTSPTAVITRARHGPCRGAKVAAQRARPLHRSRPCVRRHRSNPHRCIVLITQDRGVHLQRWSHSAATQLGGHHSGRLSRQHIQHSRSILDSEGLPTRTTHGLCSADTGHGHPQGSQCRPER